MPTQIGLTTCLKFYSELLIEPVPPSYWEWDENEEVEMTFSSKKIGYTFLDVAYMVGRGHSSVFWDIIA